MSNLAQKTSKMATGQSQSAGSSVSTSSSSPAGSGADNANTSVASKLCGARVRGHGLHRLETDGGSAHASRPGTFLPSPSSEGEDSDDEGGVSLSPGASEISPIEGDNLLTESNLNLLQGSQTSRSDAGGKLLANTFMAILATARRSSPSNSDSSSWETVSCDSASSHDSGSPGASARDSSSSGSWASGERRLDISGWSSDSSDAYDSDGHSSRTREELLDRCPFCLWERPALGALSDVPSLTWERGASSFSSTRQSSDSSAQSYFHYLARRSWPLDDEEEEFFDTQQFLGEEPSNAWEQFLVSGPLTRDVYRERVDFR